MRWVVLLVAVLSLAGCRKQRGAPDAPAKAGFSVPPADGVVEARDLWAEFQADNAAAVRKYDRKEIRVRIRVVPGGVLQSPVTGYTSIGEQFGPNDAVAATFPGSLLERTKQASAVVVTGRIEYAQGGIIRLAYSDKVALE